MQPARLSRSRISATYRWIAPIHDLAARILESEARTIAIDMAAIRDGEAILEVAVGTGLNLPHVARRNPNGTYVGIDITPAMLDRARRRLRRLGISAGYELAMGDAYDLAFEDAKFDLVINTYMFDMLPEKDFATVLRELWRVLKPGGRLVVVTMTKGRKTYQHIWEILYRIYPPLLGGCRAVSLEAHAREASFEVVRRSFVSQWTFPSEVLLCKKTVRDQTQ